MDYPSNLTFQYPIGSDVDQPWKLPLPMRLMLELKSHCKKAVPRPENIELFPLSKTEMRPLRADELAAVFVTRNNHKFIRSFLKHYREIGVSHFICVDDVSTDGTREFLLEQPDVDLYGSNVRYSSAARSKAWREKIFDRYGNDRWYLNVDSDEYLLYPTIDDEPIQAFIKRLEKQKITRMPAVMLDLYPDKAFSEAEFSGDTEDMPWDVADSFDGSGYVGVLHGKGLVVYGGVFKRIFGAAGDRIKYPLIFWSRDTSLGKSIHKPMPGKYNFAPVFGCLLHTKIFADFHESIEVNVMDNQHFNGSEYYRKILTQISDHRDSSFCYEDTVRYSGAEDLLRRGFMHFWL